jgi:hypothetical protein
MSSSPRLRATIPSRTFTSRQRSLAWICTVLLALCGFANGQEPADPRLLFYAPFEDSTDAVVAGGNPKPLRSHTKLEEGKVGKAARAPGGGYQKLSYDGRGNIDLNAGTLAFFYKPNYKLVERAYEPIMCVQTEIEGYWAAVLQFNLVKDALQFQFYDVGRVAWPLALPPIVNRWKEGEWVHLAVVWDHNQGIRVYENGEEKASSWGKQHWLWNQVPSVLNLNGGYYSAHDCSFDEVRIYSGPLPPEAIAKLALGEAPGSGVLPLVARELADQREREKRGWSEDEIKQLPAVGAKPLEIAWARIDHCVDAKRRVAQPFDGFASTCWPIQKYGASIGGRELEVYFGPGAEADRVRLFAQRPFHGQLLQPQPVGEPKALLAIDAERPVFRGQLSVPVKPDVLLLQRKNGSLGQVEFFRTRELEALPSIAGWYHGGELLKRVPDIDAGLSIKSDTSPAALRCVQMTFSAEEPGKTHEEVSTVRSPAFEGFQILTQPITESTPLEGIVVKLVAKSLPAGTPLTVTVKEPVWSQGDWCVAEVRATGPSLRQAQDLREVTLVLRPRPLLTRAGEPLAIEVVAGAPVEWIFGAKGCAVGLITTAREKVLQVHVQDQLEFIREAFSEMNEGHVFDYLKSDRGMWARLSRPAEALDEIAPANPVLMQLKRRLGWEKEPIPYPTVANPTGAPEWAVWEREAMMRAKKIIHWIIDNRQVSNGEFGGVWGDDTDMTEFWMGLWLASDDTGKIKDAMRLLMEGLWKYNLVEGVSSGIRDALHAYEEGQGCISQRMLIDYGNPTAIERVMTASTHYDKWMKKADDGKYDFRSNYFGSKGVWTQGEFGIDKGVTGLMFVQACYLLWYNHHPAVAEYVLNWRRVMDYGGMPTDAVYELKHDPAILQYYNDLVTKPEPRYLAKTINALNVVPLPADTAPLMKAVIGSRGLQPIWGLGSMHVPMETHYLAWKATGDKKYLIDSWKMAASHMHEQEWVFTAAQPSTDRIFQPTETLVRAMLGSIPCHRGGNNHLWPRHALSYESGAEGLAALVTENTEQTIKALFYTFDEKDHPIRMHVWRLPPGEYQLGLYEAPEDEHKPGKAIREWKAELYRYAAVDVILPPHQQVLFTVTPIRTQPMDYNKPDAAIGAEDISMEPTSGLLNVKVHNVGIRPVDNLVVQVREMETGVVLGEKIIPHIDAPLDLKARIEAIEFPNLDAQARRGVEVILDPQNKLEDLTRLNNRVLHRF